MLRRTLRRVSVALIAAATLGAGPVAGASAAPPGEGPGDRSRRDRLRRPLRELPRGDPSAEGLNEFAVTDVSQLNAQTLANYDVVVLARTAVSQAQLTALTNWVQAGGNLVAMRPEPQLAGLLGLGSDSGDLSEGYMRVDTGTSPGRGITGATMQFHGTADRWTLTGASTVASLYADADTATADPAVTLHSFGAGHRPRRSPTTSPARSSTPARATLPGRATSGTSSSTRCRGRTTCSTARSRATSNATG